MGKRVVGERGRKRRDGEKKGKRRRERERRGKLGKRIGEKE